MCYTIRGEQCIYLSINALFIYISTTSIHTSCRPMSGDNLGNIADYETSRIQERRECCRTIIHPQG